MKKKRKHKATVPMVNNRGQVMRIPAHLTLGDLVKMGVTEIHLVKPGTPLRDNEWVNLELGDTTPCKS